MDRNELETQLFSNLEAVGFGHVDILLDHDLALEARRDSATSSARTCSGRVPMRGAVLLSTSCCT
jgi:hypothetical protein